MRGLVRFYRNKKFVIESFDFDIDILFLLIYNTNKQTKVIGTDLNMNNRNTIQRSLVLKAVKDLACHATADEVYDKVVKRHANISRGTVYRNLNLLSDMGKIRKVKMPGGADRYDNTCHEHYHAKCMKCGKVFDVEMDFISDLENNIKDSSGFEFTGHDIIFKGICIKCKTAS